MLASQTVAERSLDLLLPTLVRSVSIFLRTCSVWPLTPADGSLATWPARYTVSPWTTAWLIRGPALWRAMLMRSSFFGFAVGALPRPTVGQVTRRLDHPSPSGRLRARRSGNSIPGWTISFGRWGSLLPVDVQPDLLVPIGDGHVPLGRRDDGGLAGGGRPELLRQVHPDDEDVPLDLHLDVLHARISWPDSGRCECRPSGPDRQSGNVRAGALQRGRGGRPLRPVTYAGRPSRLLEGPRTHLASHRRQGGPEDGRSQRVRQKLRT